MTQRILVTGHRGYIGAVLVPMLEERGYQVAGVDADFFRGCDLVPDPVASDTIEVVAADVRDLTVDHLRGFDAVLHLAALSNDPLGKLDAALTDEINHRASVEAGRLAKEAGVRRFVFSSSCSLYGASTSDVPLGEEAAFNPVTAYGRSKVDAEHGLAELADGDFTPVYLRNATAYGLSPRLRGDLVVQDLVASALFTGKIEILSDGSPWRPLVHVEDIARAFVAVLEAPAEGVHNRAFNVGRSEENFTIAQVAEMVREGIPGSEIHYAPGGGPDARSYRVNFDTLPRVVSGFRPEWTVRKGITQLAEAYRAHGLGLEDLRGERFTRLARLQRLLDSGEVDASLRWAGEPLATMGT